VSASPAFHLTRRAALDLRDIYERSRREWSEATADRYMADLYAAMNDAAANPSIGLSRRHRSAPFRMIPARRHFIVYDCIPQGIAVLTVLHQARDIESLIAGLSPSFPQEIEEIKAAKPAPTRKRGATTKRA